MDRAFDLIAPVIHEWTYEAIASDILDLRTNVFNYQAETQGGQPGHAFNTKTALRFNENDVALIL